jgi:hypothetical protein
MNVAEACSPDFTHGTLEIMASDMGLNTVGFQQASHNVGFGYVSRPIGNLQHATPSVTVPGRTGTNLRVLSEA